jgi:hypothetical protein
MDKYPHLFRLGSGSNSPGRVFSIFRDASGNFVIEEACDNYFCQVFTAEQLRELAAELVALSREG